MAVHAPAGIAGVRGLGDDGGDWASYLNLGANLLGKGFEAYMAYDSNQLLREANKTRREGIDVQHAVALETLAVERRKLELSTAQAGQILGLAKVGMIGIGALLALYMVMGR